MSEPARVGCETAEEIVQAWRKTAREAANAMMDKYGDPDEAWASLLLWHHNGPWRRTVAYREEAQHNFPTPHLDVLEQFIPYRGYRSRSSMTWPRSRAASWSIAPKG